MQISALLSSCGVAMAAAPSMFVDPLMDESVLHLNASHSNVDTSFLSNPQIAAVKQLHLLICRCALTILLSRCFTSGYNMLLRRVHL